MKKILSAVSASAIAVTGIAGAVFNSNAVETEKNSSDAIKIMCIGDSITDGYGVAGSYRKFLYNGLTQKGFNVDMVGAKTGFSTTYSDEATGETFSYDDDNTGYSGYSIKNYNGRNGIYEVLESTNCLSETKPDIVVLQIGTNNIIDNHNMDENVSDLSDLIDFILKNTPETTAVFVTTIPKLDPNRQEVYDWFSNYRHSADWQTQYSDSEAEANVEFMLSEYNSNVEKIVNDYYASTYAEYGRARVYGGNVSGAITDVKTQLVDGVHPNNAGYREMGDYWATVLEDYILTFMNVTPQETTTTTETTSTATEAVTTTSTAAVTTTTATTTKESVQTTVTTVSAEPSTTFTIPASEEEPPIVTKEYGINDAVRLLSWLHNFPESDLTEEQADKYDMNKDKRLDVFDLVLLKQTIAEDCRIMVEKFDKIKEEKGIDLKPDFSDLECVILNPEDYEPKKVTSGNSSASSTYKAINTELVDLDEDDDDSEPIIITYNK